MMSTTTKLCGHEMTAEQDAWNVTALGEASGEKPTGQRKKRAVKSEFAMWSPPW